MLAIKIGLSTNADCAELHIQNVVKSYDQKPQNEIAKEITAQEDEYKTVLEETDDEPQYIQYYTEQDAIDIAKVLYTECGCVNSKTEQACVAWTILNRADKCDSTIYSVVREPNQYVFRSGSPVEDELLELSYDVLERWNREKNGETNVGRVLPADYIFFYGDGTHNYFRNKFNGSYNIWDYSLESPYEN